MYDVINKSLEINIDNYSGPLEILLDLAKTQKVDLANISITQLADQFIDFMNKAKEINLDLASEYLLMATWLAYLKSKLLLPQDDEDEFRASEVAEKLKLQLKKLELIRLLSAQLLRKNRLGVDIKMRGMPEGIRLIKSSRYAVTLYDWRELSELIPSKFKTSEKLRKTGIAGFFSASLELTKEGIIRIMQEKSFAKILIKEKK